MTVVRGATCIASRRGFAAGRRYGFAAGIGVLVAMSTATATAALEATDAPSSNVRVERLNAAFLAHLEGLTDQRALAVTTIRDGWVANYKDKAPDSFVPDALAVLYPAYREALAAFDAGQSRDVVRLLEPLRNDGDPFLAANAMYFHTRALVDLGRFEEVQQNLKAVDAQLDDLAAHTPYAPHLAFIKAFSEARNLDFDAAAASLKMAAQRFPEAPEAVRIGGKQLLLELERREVGTLDEVATVMNYVADRLRVEDAAERVHQRQDQIIAMLDKLIEENEQQEQQQSGGGSQGRGKSQKGGRAQNAPQNPSSPADTSEAPAGSGEVGDLHTAPKVEPGEMWGKLPPAEREKILQSIRDRFPSRYRQLVEQYYRSLAEQK